MCCIVERFLKDREVSWTAKVDTAMISPTLAFDEAREVCADVCALFSGASVDIQMPSTTWADQGNEARIHYDEYVRVYVMLRLPPLPSRLPPSDDDVSRDVWDKKTRSSVPSMLTSLLESLHLSLEGTLNKEQPIVLFRHQWQGMSAQSSFVLEPSNLGWTDDVSDANKPTPLQDERHTPGIVYDSQQKSWAVCWTSDIRVSFGEAKLPTETLCLRAEWDVRLDLARWVSEARVPPPQTPFHYTSNELHPFTHAQDPYMIDVDLLSEWADGVKLPDETPEQRHRHISKQLTMLPASMLARHAVGTPLIAPWSEALALSDRLRQAKEMESVALAQDEDIALSTLSASSPAAMSSTTKDALTIASTLDIPALASAGHIVLRRNAEMLTRVSSTIHVRMRTLHRTIPLGDDGRERGVLVAVELDNTSKESTYCVHALTIDIGESVHAAESMSFVPLYSSVVRPIVQLLPGSPSSFPMELGPHAQYNLLYTVQLACVCKDPAEITKALSTWHPRRMTRVTLHGTPERQTSAPSSTCISQWNGAIDLSLAQLDGQREAFAANVVYRAIGASPQPSRKEAREGASIGRLSKTASALAASLQGPAPPPKPSMPLSQAGPSQAPLFKGQDVVPVPRTPSPTYASPLQDAQQRAAAMHSSSSSTSTEGSMALARRAVGWDAAPSQGMVFDPMHVQTFASAVLATIHVDTSASDRGCALIHVHMSFFNVSSKDMDVEVTWLDTHTRPGTLVPETHRLRLGYVYMH